MARPKKTEGEETAAPKQQNAMQAFMTNKKYENTKVDKSKRYITKGVPTPLMNLNYLFTRNPFYAFEFGRMAEVWGDDDSGKTTFCLEVVLEFCLMYRIPVLYVDSEKRLSLVYAFDLIGVDESLFELRRPRTGEQAWELIKDAILAGFKLIINDSVAANTPSAILKGKAEDHHMGVHARLTGPQSAVVNALCEEHGATVLFVNQKREKIGQMGDPTITTGGNEFRFYLSYRIRLFDPRGDKILASSLSDFDAGEKEIDNSQQRKEVGKEIRMNIIKNKSSFPRVDATAKIYYGQGYDRRFSRLEFYKMIGLVTLVTAGFITTRKNKYTWEKFFNKIEKGERWLELLKKTLPHIEDWSHFDRMIMTGDRNNDKTKIEEAQKEQKTLDKSAGKKVKKKTGKRKKGKKGKNKESFLRRLVK